jgi:hypothetical protein
VSVLGSPLFFPLTSAVEHPFILWTKEDAAAVHNKVKTEARATAAYRKLVENPDRNEASFSNLVEYAVTGGSGCSLRLRVFALRKEAAGQSRLWRERKATIERHPLAAAPPFADGLDYWVRCR